jgi:methylenetetrahydrofolate dehydrogenase (NADP+) / methenyltetrahydrofolate cyclohydrolase
VTTVGAAIIDGKEISGQLRASVAEQAAAFRTKHRRPPGLATILVGDDPASAVYVAAKRKASEGAGIESFHHSLSGDISQRELLSLVRVLAEDERVDGILCQLPLPDHLDSDAVIATIPPQKDVDGLTVENAGRLALGQPGIRPCTPLGVMFLLDQSRVQTRGSHAVVIGRSNLFGKPMERLLMLADATVTQCHRHTVGLPDIARQADILVAAVGRPELVRGDWIKPGATVIDVGITRTQSGLVGDVCFAEAVEVASAITPVPGGVGPMTIACLLQNTIQAAQSGV